MKIYEVLYYDGWGNIPAYYLIDSAKGETPEQALKENLENITLNIRQRKGKKGKLVMTYQRAGQTKVKEMKNGKEDLRTCI